jgi:hypothetical protein
LSFSSTDFTFSFFISFLSSLTDSLLSVFLLSDFSSLFLALTYSTSFSSMGSDRDEVSISKLELLDFVESSVEGSG